MSNASKMVADRRRSTEHVEQAAGVHRARIVEALTETLDEEAAAAAGVLVDKAISSLSRKSDGMARADQAHTDELADDGPARTARETAAAELTDKLVRDRMTLGGLAGAAYLDEVGFIGATPAQPHLLLPYAETIARRLTERPAPKVEERGISFDPKEWAKGYEAPIEKLRAALKEVAKEAHEADGTLVDKRRTMDAHDRAFSVTASLLSVLLEAAGEQELARRVRPSSRRKGVTEAIETGVDPLEPSPEPAPVPTPEPEPVDA